MKSLLLLFLFVLLTACSSLGGGTDTTRFYSLSTQSDNASVPPSRIRLGIGPVKLPHQLKRPQIVTRINQNELHVNEQHQWAGSLKEDVTQVLSDNLESLTGTEQIEIFPWKRHFRPHYQVRVQIEQFDGEPGKNITLKARWWLRSQNSNTDKLAKKSIITVPAKGTDFSSYVAALSQALDKLSREIARHIKAQ